MAKRLEKLDVGGKQSWYFVNEQQGTIRYRELLFPFPELNCFDQADGTDFEILEVLEWPQIKTLGEQVHVDPSSIKKEELHQWIRIVAQHESPSGQKTIVPTTSIRKLYEFMRDDFEDRDFRRGLLNVFAESPKALVKLCKESFKQFASYENLSEGWGSSSRKRLPDAPDRESAHLPYLSSNCDKGELAKGHDSVRKHCHGNGPPARCKPSMTDAPKILAALANENRCGCRQCFKLLSAGWRA